MPNEDSQTQNEGEAVKNLRENPIIRFDWAMKYLLRDNEQDYLKRILFGVSNIVAKSVQKGESYIKIRKVYSVTIAFFDLGLGDDYIYHGSTKFIGRHSKTELLLTKKQKKVLGGESIPEIYPEYYIIKVGSFNEER